MATEICINKDGDEDLDGDGRGGEIDNFYYQIGDLPDFDRWHDLRKRVLTTQENVLLFDLPANEGTSNTSNASKPRWEKSGFHDPSFQRAGLHIDPNLRTFASQ